LTITLRRFDVQRLLILHRQTLRVVPVPGESGVYSHLKFHSPSDVYLRLKTYQFDPRSMINMRQVLDEVGAYNVKQLSDDAVIQEVANRVDARWIAIAAELILPNPTLLETEEPDAPAPAPMAARPAPAPEPRPEPEPEAPIDQDAQAEALVVAAENGTPFCEECEATRAAAPATEAMEPQPA
jgi:hypothetical protein